MSVPKIPTLDTYDAVWSWNPLASRTLPQPSFEALTGLSYSDYQSGWLTAVHPSDRHALLQHALPSSSSNTTIPVGRSWRTTTRIRCKTHYVRACLNATWLNNAWIIGCLVLDELVLDVNEVLSRGGVMGKLVREKDWSCTELGCVQQWSSSLVTAVSFLLRSAFPFILFWGPSRCVIYNDGYIPIFGTKHPHILGAPAFEAWGEVWDVIAPMLDQTFAGEATWSEDQLLLLTRSGYVEGICYFTWSYSPVRNEDGSVGGAMTPITETTQRVLSERRLLLLRELGAVTGNVQSEEEACTLAANVFREQSADLPFTLIYILDPTRQVLVLRESTHLSPGHSACIPELPITTTTPWPFSQVLTTRTRLELDLTTLPHSFPGRSISGTHSPCTHALLLPIGEQDPMGVFIAGVNPLRALDANYKFFMEQARAQLAAAMSTGRAYREEKKRAEALAEIDRAKTAFFSNVSHEFRTPLTLILGPLSDVLDDPTLSSSHRDALQVMHRNSLRLLKLVNSILDFSRIEAGRMQALYKPTDLGIATANAASMFRAAIEKAGLEFVVDVCEGEEVYVDLDMWEKIVFNLLSNAFKNTLKGGIYVHLASNPTTLSLSVRDTGCGVPETDLTRLFERFYRADTSHGRSHEGTGIGLALTLELAKLHGGTIDVSSTVGTGTIFTVHIPRGKNHLPPDRIQESDVTQTTGTNTIGESFVAEALRWSDPPDLGPSPPTRLLTPPLSVSDTDDDRPRILLADDNADMRSYVSGLLRACVVRVVADGVEAYEWAVREPPDLILSDVMMPRMNGFELLARIKSHPILKSIPFILLSARAGDEARVEGLQAGADDYLVKPFSARELRARIKTHLDLGRLRGELERLVQQRTAALAESERRYRLLADLAPVGILQADPTGHIEFTNDRWWHILGRDRTNYHPTDWESFVHPDDRTLMSTNWSNALSKLQPYQIECRCITEGGSIVHVMTEGVPDVVLKSDGTTEHRGWYLATIDISERKALEAERLDRLRNAEAEQRKRAEEAEENRRHQEMFIDMICHEIRNPLNGVINNADLVRLNLRSRRTLCEILWKIAQSHADLVPPALAQSTWTQWTQDLEAIDAIEMCTRHQKVITDDVLNLSKLRSERIVLAPIQCSPEQVTLAVIRMFSAELRRKKIECTAYRVHGHLPDPPPPKTTLLNTYHVTPITTDSQTTTVLIDPDRLSQVLFNLVSNAIKFANTNPRLDPGIATPFSSLPCVMHSRITIFLEYTWGAPVLPLSSALSPSSSSSCVASTSPSHSTQCPPPHSTTTATITNSTTTHHSTPPTHLLITIHDNGKGMTETDESALQASTPANLKTYRDYTSNALGLFICKQFVDIMGGWISVERCAEGTEIRVCFLVGNVSVSPPSPLVLSSSSTSLPSLDRKSVLDSSQDLPPTNLSVLIVEDNLVNQRVLKRQLDLAGFKSQVANNGAEAVEMTEKEQFDVVIMDLEMPVMDGLEATQRIRAREAHLPRSLRHTPILGLSGNARREFQEKALGVGMNRFMVKPYDRKELVGCLVGLVGQGR
ncbi:PAS domain S-box protein [Spizellomyces punctatus DAOM BR117]|uniref:histidine kinase n=1 Tax=Spizellomyces punctatus (strain DAOM BR117) TaxID=645134 RepID=A0A0L0HET3_SPIPD|nr:PAS domain S-box protein [Spizellomyces punctatus DAOM BR117]KNC99582.1 PAS domain S-box protein [Spizellomyces punctatus DAOM BR117]|eukprot:XP_016607622.1 PAS domain S-box protein [Spizellomyces punctatus DAOM BR117]